jgi:hypothetical protein
MNAFPSRRCLGLLVLASALSYASSALAQTPTPTSLATAPSATASQTASSAGTNPAPGFLVIGDSDKGFSAKRFEFILGGAVITFLLYYFLSGLHPLRLIVGVDNRYSNSQFQVALWFFVVIASYVATFAVRWRSGVIGGIDIPQHLLLISGMSALTYGAAKGITTSKVNDALANGRPSPKTAAAAPSLLNDLTHNDLTPPAQAAPADPNAPAPPPAPPPAPTGLDLGDTQMVIVTLLAVASYLVSFYYFLGAQNFGSPAIVTLPDADATILSIFGLGQGAYLVKKAVGNAGQS